MNQRFILSPVTFHMSKLGVTPAPFNENHLKFFDLFDRLHLQNLLREKSIMNYIPFDRYCSSLKQNIEW